MEMDIPFEIGPRATLTEALVEAVVKRFELGKVSAFRDMGGAFNLNVRIHTFTGVYVVRVYRPWVSSERLACLHRVKRIMWDAGFPVPIPLGMVSGDEIGFYPNRWIEVEPWVEQDGVADTWSRYTDAFTMLGRLHRTMAAHVDTRTFVAPHVQNYALPETMLVWLEQSEKHIASLESTPETRDAVRILEETGTRLESINRWWHQIGRLLPQQPVHGDFGGDNILFREERIVALLDFDLMAIHERVFELAYSLYFMFRRFEYDVPPAERSWRRIGHMLTAYDSTADPPLTALERRSIPIQMARVPLYWIAEAHWTPDPVQSIISSAEGVQVSRWILAHADELAGRLIS